MPINRLPRLPPPTAASIARRPPAEEPPAARVRTNTAGESIQLQGGQAELEEIEDVQMEDNKKQGGPRRRRARAQQTEEERKSNKYELKGEKAVKTLTATHLKATLGAMQRLRELEGTILETGLVASDSRLVTGMKEEGAQYSKACQEAGRGHTLGPPHVHSFLRLIDETVACLQEESELLTPIKEMQAKLAEQEIGTIAANIRACKVARCYRAETAKIIFAIRTPAQHMLVRGALEEAAVRWTMGKAPASSQEDELSKWLEALGLKQK